MQTLEQCQRLNQVTLHSVCHRGQRLWWFGPLPAPSWGRKTPLLFPVGWIETRLLGEGQKWTGSLGDCEAPSWSLWGLGWAAGTRASRMTAQYHSPQVPGGVTQEAPVSPDWVLGEAGRAKWGPPRRPPTPGWSRGQPQPHTELAHGTGVEEDNVCPDLSGGLWGHCGPGRDLRERPKQERARLRSGASLVQGLRSSCSLSERDSSHVRDPMPTLLLLKGLVSPCVNLYPKKKKRRGKGYFLLEVKEYSNATNLGGTSLLFQWLILWASTSGGMGSIPGQGTKISHATWYGWKYINTTIYLNLYLYILNLAAPGLSCSVWDLVSSLTRNWTQLLCMGRAES